MAGKKGMKHYPPAIKADIVEQHRNGKSVHALSREYGISRYAIQNWCGLTPKNQEPPRRRGRPRKYPITDQREMELEIKRLKTEVELLRSFLQAVGRRWDQT